MDDPGNYHPIKSPLCAGEDNKEAAKLCRDGIKKAKAQFELNLARDAKEEQERLLQVPEPQKESPGVSNPLQWVIQASW